MSRRSLGFHVRALHIDCSFVLFALHSALVSSRRVAPLSLRHRDPGTLYRGETCKKKRNRTINPATIAVPTIAGI